LALLCPFRSLVLLKQLHRRLGYLRKILYESSIVAC
jgi:hypothetical protein